MSQETKIRKFEITELLLSGRLQPNEERIILDELRSNPDSCAETELNYVIAAVLRNESFEQSKKEGEPVAKLKTETAEKTGEGNRKKKEVIDKSDIHVEVTREVTRDSPDKKFPMNWIIALCATFILLALLAWIFLR